MKIRILKSAKTDLAAGFRFYDAKQDRLGFCFLETLYSDIDSLLLFAGVHSIHFGKYHRLLSKRFPFAVYYRITDGEILISAVVDCRRNPAWIRKHLG
ncbi:MAG: type II toxin-antitoxin system RelE/ParE family toxin [Kiritimatiellae bacterium]|nr:type II toxin-antitoxin system RelE/ParE family toxin [Kiritimatiellia bacterium]